MNQSTIDARIAFAKNCVRGATRAELTGERRLAAELCGAAREALRGLGDASRVEALDPRRSRTQAIASVILNALH